MRAAGYARYSTDLQQPTTIIAQHKAITEYCLANGLDLVDSFVDEGRSGTNTDRKGFHALLCAARARSFEAVVIYDISRGSRDVVDWFQFRKEMMALEIQVFSCSEKLGDISRPGDFLTEVVTVAMGQHQVLQSREKSIAGKQVRAGQGKFCGGVAPLGYQIVDGRYEIVEREAAAVRLAFEWYAAGRSYNEITQAIKNMGIVGRQGRFIANNTLYFILRNERYTGKFIWFESQNRYMHKWVGKKNSSPTVIENAIPRIIDQDTWERVQRRVSENTYNKTNKSRKGRVYLLSGLLHCAKCGGAFVGTTTIAKGREYKSYVCATKQRQKTCDAKSIKADEIETAIVTLLRNDILNGDLIEQTADAIIQSRKEHQGASSEELKRELSGLETRLRNLLRTLEDGFDSESIRARVGELEAQQKLLRDQIKETLPIAGLDRDALVAKLRRDTEKLLADPGSTGELIREYIIRVDIGAETIDVYGVADAMDKKEGPQLELIRCGHDWLPR